MKISDQATGYFVDIFVDERQKSEAGKKDQHPLGSLEHGDNMQTF